MPEGHQGQKHAAGFFLGWLWTLAAGAAGAFFLLQPGQALAGAALILSALTACPLIATLLEKQGTKLGGGVRLGLAVIFAGFAGLSLAQNPAAFEKALAPAPVQAKTLLEDSGDFGNKTTKVFTPQGADWDLQWTFDCASLGDSGNFSAKVMLQGGGASGIAPLERLSDKDSGTEHYHQAGSFYLQVVSECRWTVKVVG